MIVSVYCVCCGVVIWFVFGFEEVVIVWVFEFVEFNLFWVILELWFVMGWDFKDCKVWVIYCGCLELVIEKVLCLYCGMELCMLRVR